MAVFTSGCSDFAKSHNERYRNNKYVNYDNTFLFESNDSDFVFTDTPDGYTIEKYTGTEKIVVFPREHNNKKIKRISEGVFIGNSTKIDVVYVGGNITEIAPKTFAGCSSLRKVVLSGGVKQIGSYAFSECSNLKVVTIESKLETISDCIFSGCASLKQFKIPKSVRSISINAFSELTPSFELLVYSGSYGEEFAKNHNIKYEIV